MTKKTKWLNRKRGQKVNTSSLASRVRQPKIFKLTVFVLVFGVIGTVMLFRSFAAGSSVISGYAFDDTNKNGVLDAGEPKRAGEQLYLFNGDRTVYMGTTVIDSQGYYAFTGLDEGDYSVEYAATSHVPIQLDLVPTTTGSIYPRNAVHLVSSATANFGWRPITRSNTLGSPISNYTAPNGMRVESYNDAVTAQSIYNTLSQALIGQEAGSVIVRFDYIGPNGGNNITSSGWQKNSSGVISNCSSASYSLYSRYLYGTGTLLHEYGHAWANYFGPCVQQDPTFTGYIKARGLYGDSRLNTNNAWQVQEMIAEDYRQLFGGIDAEREQANKDIPLAKDVPGLKEYLSGPFRQAPSVMVTAPANLNGVASSTEEGPAVQLSWQASTGASTYEIYRNGQKIGFVNAPSVTYFDASNLSFNTSYSYYVKAVSSSGAMSPASNTITVSTGSADTTKPSAPGALSSPTQTQTTISLKWTASTDNVGIAAYRIYQLGGGRKNQTTNLVGTSSSLSFTVSGLTKGTSYGFYVTAVDAAGNESLPSKTLTVKTKR